MTAAELLSAVRQAQGLRSNYALSRFLDVPEKSVQRWNTGANCPDDAMAARLADLAGLDPDAVVAAMHAQRAHVPEERARWERIASRLATAAGILAAAILALWTSDGGDGGAILAGVTSSALWITDVTPYTLARIAEAAALAFLALQAARFLPRLGVRMQLAGGASIAA